MSEFSYRYHLIGFTFCPFVQRSVITLLEKGVPYTIEHIDPANRPPWFHEISPLGKVPILKVTDEKVNEVVLFESAVINEFIEESAPGTPLHPRDPLNRAHHRAWIEVASDLLRRIFRMATADTEKGALAAAEGVRDLLEHFDEVLEGPFFGGERFSLVDAAAAPALQRLGWCEALSSLQLFDSVSKVRAWRDALLARPSVKGSTVATVREDYISHVASRGSWIASR